MPTNFAARLNRVLIALVITLLVTQLLTLKALRQNKVNTAEDMDQAGDSEVPGVSCTATVRVRWLNQRSGPNESSPITGGARRGEAMIGIGWNESRHWLLVSTSDGSAWMYASYMRLSGGCASLPVYSAENGSVEPEAQSQRQPAVPSGNVETTAAATLSPVFTPEVQYWSELILTWAAEYQMDPNLIATVIQIESCGDPAANSSAGAQGLFQVMPFHFAAGEDMLDVETNARRGLDYLQGALERSNGDVGLALVGYNGGYSVMNGGWAAETQRYYYWGSGIYAEAVSGAAVSATLEAWLAAGGTSLCARASESLRSLE